MPDPRVRFNSIILRVLVGCGALAARLPAEDAKLAGPAVRAELLVSTAWLKAHLKDSEVVVLHVADKRQDFLRGHIPGARFLATAAFIDDSEPMSELPAPARLKETFESLGVTDRAKVVIYTTGWYPNAARAFFTLEYLGHAHAALLDGGIDRWIDEGLPIAAGAASAPRGSMTLRLQESARATTEETRRASEDRSGTVQIMDSRPPRRYTAGHIPGARPLFWQEAFQGPDQPLYLPPERLRALFEAKGLVPGRKVISYCEVGLQASVGYFLARYLGLEAGMYDGSFHEWNDRQQLPVVKGDGAR